jgi:iron complex outermembrane receptor protein
MPGTTTVQGLELESNAIATDWLTVGATYAYMDTHFDQHATNPPAGHIPYAPRHQVHLSAEVHFEMPEIEGRIAVAGDYTFHSKVFFNNANNHPAFIVNQSPWNDIINAHAEYTSDDSLWRVSVWGKNLTDDRPLLHGADVSVFFDNIFEGGSVFLAKYYPERTFGVTVTRNF